MVTNRKELELEYARQARDAKAERIRRENEIQANIREQRLKADGDRLLREAAARGRAKRELMR